MVPNKLGRSIPFLLKISACLYNGRWSVYLLTIICANNPAVAFAFGNGFFGNFAHFTVSSHPLHAYLYITCSLTCNFAGIKSNCSLFSSPILLNWHPQLHFFSSSSRSYIICFLGKSFGSFFLPFFLLCYFIDVVSSIGNSSCSSSLWPSASLNNNPSCLIASESNFSDFLPYIASFNIFT